MAGCSTDTDTSSAGGGGDFDFTAATPAGAVIPAESRQTAPAYAGELLDGTDFTSASVAGDIVVLNFWGSWCAPCRVESPEFQTVSADVAEAGVAFLGVAVRDQRQLAQAFVTDFAITYPSLFDPSGEVALAFRGFPANVVPTTILIDRDNRVAGVYVSAVTEEDLRAILQQLLEEAPPTTPTPSAPDD
ncbi:Thiol-disulfide isomerase or thioredoxin [Klenkia marina]|uniref:Thiol-disulfide isomerase or thioredoxin n=1 Tax=Klenkia marina TaxID=1960309 RepID=A0A1G4Z4S5_9ACTN|nr:TlpA disulfide reductase family protein [Klenkia marina]SCX60278.1 Thiol-disulfide isomerase or thioredoxin [Klenkia marina]